MKYTTPIKSKNNDTLKGLRHPLEYDQFVLWVATPEPLREPHTQSKLAEKFGVGDDTLSEWKQREGFWDDVRREIHSWGKNRTPNVVHALYKKAISGKAAEVKLWLQYIDGFSEKSVTQFEPPRLRKDIDEIISLVYGRAAKKKNNTDSNIQKANENTT